MTCGAILCVLTAGCGQSSTDKAAARLHTSLVALSMDEAYGQILRDINRPGRLDADLVRYDAAARAMAGTVGKERVEAILARKATAISDLCGRCAAAFDRTRESL